ncbi:ribonucleotide reductase inhibitor-domain-containing protein [Xylaria sp. CBS 124048]|nr:ribonucleotide reductase inhibitor-domain-containing protein [Xylaria sp. CBS 124048]
MSAPRTKRQFAGAASNPAQQQITSFFTSTANTTTTSSSSTHLSHNTSSSSPKQHSDNPLTLPASVQANLLSVGMRVRKSVPEGYKTGSYNAFALWDENDTGVTAKTIRDGQRSRANAFSSPRELLPFCGIHKVGGLDTQPEHNGHALSSSNSAIISDSNCWTSIYEGVPGLTNSQDSVESTASASPTAPTRKRFFVEDEEEVGNPTTIPDLWRHNNNNNNNNNNGADSRSLAPVALVISNSSRAIAMPRKRSRVSSKAPRTAAGISSAGQENVMIVDSDFEEADFLDRQAWEVDMNNA